MSECKEIQVSQLLDVMAASASVRAALAQFVSVARSHGYDVNAASATLTFYELEGDFVGRWEIGNITEESPFVGSVGGSL